MPLYSTDSGLIDASTQLKDAIPKLDEKSKEEPAAEQDKKQRVKSKSAKNARGKAKVDKDG